MENICLCKMTKELCRKYYHGFVYDQNVFMEDQIKKLYRYSDATADAYFDKQAKLARIHLAIMLNNEPIGEIIFKNINLLAKACNLSIHLKNDSVKNKGYGTRAEILALQFAFDNCCMETVLADALKKNVRSQKVLKRVGFVEIHQDEIFCYFRCDKFNWKLPKFV